MELEAEAWGVGGGFGFRIAAESPLLFGSGSTGIRTTTEERMV